MYKYVNDISKMAHKIISDHIDSFNIAVDATLGNGNDTDFLKEKFNLVYSFDIQKDAIDAYEKKKNENVVLIHDSHDNLKMFVHEKVDCIIYNLGFLPGGDKSITTNAYSTIRSLNQGLEILNPGGIISIAAYIGHEEGKREKDEVLDMVKKLPKNEYGVLIHSFLNRNNSPLLVIIEKNSV